MIRLLLLASEVQGLLCSHIDWTALIPTGSLRNQEIRARPDPRLFILGCRAVLWQRGWVGRGDEQRRHFPPGSKALTLTAAAAAAPAAAATASLSFKGGFSKPASPGRRRSQTAWRVALYPLPLRTKSRIDPSKAARIGPICHFLHLKRRTYSNTKQIFFVFLFFCAHFCERMPLFPTFQWLNRCARRCHFPAKDASVIYLFFPPLVCVCFPRENEKVQSGFRELIQAAAYLNLLRFVNPPCPPPSPLSQQTMLFLWRTARQ